MMRDKDDALNVTVRSSYPHISLKKVLVMYDDLVIQTVFYEMLKLLSPLVSKSLVTFCWVDRGAAFIGPGASLTIIPRTLQEAMWKGNQHVDRHLC